MEDLEIKQQEEFQRQAIYTACIKLIRIVKEHPEISENFAFGMVKPFFDTLTELRKPSESEPKKSGCYQPIVDATGNPPIGRTDEDLVQKIESVMYSNAAPLPASGLQIIYIDSVNKIATEIAKLIPSSRCQENAVNVELLEAAKYFKNIVITNWHHIAEDSSKASKHIKSITNAEKQINKTNK